MSMTASRYECPVDGCRWNHEVVAPPLDIPDGPAVGTVYRTTVENTEAVLAAHFRGHSTEDYLRTIVRLRKIEAAARVVVDLDEPIAYGGAMWELREALGDEP